MQNEFTLVKTETLQMLLITITEYLAEFYGKDTDNLKKYRNIEKEIRQELHLRGLVTAPMLD